MGRCEHPFGGRCLWGLGGVYLQLLCIQDRTAECYSGKHLERYLPPSGGRSGFSRYLVLRPVDVSAAGGRLPAVSGLFYPPCAGLCPAGYCHGKQQMQRAWRHILGSLCVVLQNDTKIRADAFTEEFTVEKFAETLFSLMLSAWCGRTLTPLPCWRSSGEPSTKKHPTKLWDIF